MLYSEFLKGTRAPETPDTYDQFQIIGQIYEDCEGMTKEEAYRIWKQTYGRELKRRELRQRERLELLINREDYDSADRPHRAAIYHELSTLFWAAYYNKDGTLYVDTLDEAVRYQEALVSDLEDRCNVLEIKEDGKHVGWLKNVVARFNNGESLDATFTLTYEVAYKRKGWDASTPTADVMYTRLDVKSEK